MQATLKKTSVAILALVLSFCFGFTVKTILTKPGGEVTKKKVTGIGGIFFKCKDPGKLREWYKTQLGFNTNSYGTLFEWYERPDSLHKARTQWTPFKETTTYFAPSTKDFMINYRVEDLTSLVAELKKSGVTIVDTMETYDYGKFIHIMDPEGNKVELWEPIERKK